MLALVTFPLAADIAEMKDSIDKTTVFLVVHPGSACGSANFNLGSQLAHSYRQDLVRDISAWTGDLFIIDGELSEELEDEGYDGLGTALKEAEKRCAAAGFRVRREWGCDNIPPHQDERIQCWIDEGALDPITMKMTLTGAWYNTNEETGCVTGVAKQLAKAGFDVDIRDSVVCEDEDCDFDEDDEPSVLSP